MRNCFCRVAIMCLCGSLASCGGTAREGASTSAEVPQRGPAFADDELEPPPEGQFEPDITTPADTEGPFSDAPENVSAGDGVTLSIMTWDEAQRLVASKAGRVVVLDLWATSCVPCRREFPHLVQLHRDRGDDVACISYSMDYAGRSDRPPEYYREAVLEFLSQQGAAFDNVLGSDDPDALHVRLDLAAIPAVYVYDRRGKLRKRFDNEDPGRDEFTYERDVIPFVESLLAED